MNTFLIYAALLVAASSAGLALPFLRRRRGKAVETDRRAANLVIFRDQLSELERERAEGSLGEAAFAEAHGELQRRLLDELAQEEAAAPVGSAAQSRLTPFFIALFVAVFAAGGYALLGAPAALDPANTSPQHRVTAGEIDSMVEKLAARLEANPDDANGWVMLARSYKMLQRYADAARAYERVADKFADQPGFLTDYAEVLAISGGGFRGKPAELLEKSLQLDADDPQANLLAGAAAGERSDFAAAVRYWEKALAGVEPGSEDAAALAGAIAQARAALNDKKP